MSATAGAVFPWRDDALLSGESLYALWNKLAWFAATSPSELLRQCRAKGGKQFTTPKEFAYSPPADWTSYLNQAAVPMIQRVSLFNALRFRALAEAVEVPAEWRSPNLRFCGQCIAGGVHLRLHQHLAVTRCPIHNRALRSGCPACGCEIEYTSRNWQPAFSCTSCGRGLLRKGVIHFGWDDAFAGIASRSSLECRKWLRRLHAMPSLREPLTRKLGKLEGALPDADPRLLSLAALEKCSKGLPVWLRRYRPKDYVISVASGDPDEVHISDSIRTIRVEKVRTTRFLQPTRHLVEAWNQDAGAGERMVLRHYHRAIMRVASCFLRQVGAKHRTCLNTPCEIAGETLENALLGWQWHVLDCCPIALGFWLWRLQTAAGFIQFLQSGPSSCTRTMGRATPGPSSSPVCYAAERSRLHACILVAHRCQMLWQQTRKPFPALRILDEWAHGPGAFTAPERARLCIKGAERKLIFLRIDVTSLMNRIACLGDAASRDWTRYKVGVMDALREELERVEG